eukprot:4125071-Pleurochrysis_carterae.AAC.1
MARRPNPFTRQRRWALRACHSRLTKRSTRQSSWTSQRSRTRRRRMLRFVTCAYGIVLHSRSWDSLSLVPV